MIRLEVWLYFLEYENKKYLPGRKAFSRAPCIISRNRIHSPGWSNRYSSLWNISSFKKYFSSISPNKTLQTHKLERHFLETFFSQIFRFWTKSVLITSTMISCNWPWYIDQISSFPDCSRREFWKCFATKVTSKYEKRNIFKIEI